MVTFNKQQRHRVMALFRAFDYDSSGGVDKSEFMAIGQALKGDAWDEKQNNKAFKRVDSDKGGEIDINEFTNFFEANIKDINKFDARMTRLMGAAIAGRANFYATNSAYGAFTQIPEDAPEGYKRRVEAANQAAATAHAEGYVGTQINRFKRRDQYDRAAQYAAEYASSERELVRQRRQAKATGNYFCEPESKLMFVIRIRGMCDMHPKTKKILQLLRLRQIHLGVFLRVNKATQEMIKRVEPYLAYGYPSLKATRSLIYKRGFGKKKTAGQAQRVPLTDNAVIEEHLGCFNINCFEDLVHEIYTVGPHFKEANNFLWPFKLNSAKGGLPKKRLGFNEGGQAGNRENYTSDLIFRML